MCRLRKLCGFKRCDDFELTLDDIDEKMKKNRRYNKHFKNPILKIHLRSKAILTSRIYWE